MNSKFDPLNPPKGPKGSRGYIHPKVKCPCPCCTGKCKCCNGSCGVKHY